MFWSDDRQAEERLRGSFITYDGVPCRVEGIEYSENGQNGLILITKSGDVGNIEKVKLSDPKFNNYRVLPKLGWLNFHNRYMVAPLYLSRIARAGGRLHGLSDDCVTVNKFDMKTGKVTRDSEIRASAVMATSCFLDMQNGEFPTLEEILLNIEPGTAIAYSPSFCVYRCTDGVRWLYRRKERVGMFTGANSLSLFPKLGFYKEEIMEDPLFTLDTIGEF